MGLLDKMKDQANVVATKAQESATVVGDRLAQSQLKHKQDALFRDLGKLVFEKHSGSNLPDHEAEFTRLLDELKSLSVES